MTGPETAYCRIEEGWGPKGIRPTHPVRRSEVKQARQRSARKQATSKNRGRQRSAQQACRKGRRKREGDRNRPVEIKADGTKRLRTPGDSPSKEHIPEDQGSTSMRQASAPEEAEQSDRSLQALQLCNAPRGPSRSSKTG